MKDEYVSLIPTRDATNAIQWTVIHNGHIGSGGSFPDIDLEKGGGNYSIQFTIVDPNNLGIKFDSRVVDNGSKPKAINAIYIAEGSGSPKVAGPYPEQFDKVQLQANTTRLVLGDRNSEEGVYTYQLNFVDAAGQPVTSIDPEIRNGGGGGKAFFGLEAVTVLLGLAVLALTALLWFSGFRSGRARAKPSAPSDS